MHVHLRGAVPLDRGASTWNKASIRSNTLQHTATHLKHTTTQEQQAAHCNTLETHCNTLQHTTTQSNTLQPTATHYDTLQHTVTHCNTLETHHSTLQHTATHLKPGLNTVLFSRYTGLFWHQTAPFRHKIGLFWVLLCQWTVLPVDSVSGMHPTDVLFTCVTCHLQRSQRGPFSLSSKKWMSSVIVLPSILVLWDTVTAVPLQHRANPPLSTCTYTQKHNTPNTKTQKDMETWRGGGLGSRPKKKYGERLGDGVEYHLMSPTPHY